MLHRLSLNPWNVSVGGMLGLALFMVGTKVATWFPDPLPFRAENVRAELRPDTKRWRIEEDIIVTDNCRLIVFERRFRDEVLDRWVMLKPVDSSPLTMEGGIARADISKGRRVGWAEYDVAASGLQRGIYTVNVAASECAETGFNGTYSLIPLVPYDFTGVPRP